MSYVDLACPAARERVLWAFDAGIDTASTAAFLAAPEPDVASALSETLFERRRDRLAKRRRFTALAAAWDAEDVDRTEVARRFGFATARAASAALSDWRGRRPEPTRARVITSREALR